MTTKALSFTESYNNVATCRKICHYIAKVSDLTYIHESDSEHSCSEKAKANVEIHNVLKNILGEIYILESVVIKNMCMQGKTHQKHVLNYVPESQEARNIQNIYVDALDQADKYFNNICSKIK